jgi:non-ribosomal peptide synthetase component F
VCADVANEIQEDRVNSEPLENKNTYESDDSSSSDDDSNKLNLFNLGPLNYSTDLTSVDSDGEVTFDQIATMSFSQSRLWFPFKLLDDPTTYNCTTSYRLCGVLDVERLEAALQCIVRKHQVFRTCFYTDHSSGNAMQAISSISPFELKIVRNADKELQVDHEADLISNHVFNLEEGDSFIATLLEHADQVHTIIFGYHHIALDGVSWQQFLQELERFYIDPSKSLHQPYDYIDFSMKQRVEANSSGTLKKRNFWKDYFAELPLPIPLFPFAKAGSRKALQRYEVTEYFVELDQALVARIKDMATANHCTTFHYYLAALQVMLCKLLGIENVCIGITDANRTDQNFMNTIGLMLDSLPLWFRLQSDMESFKDRLLNTRDTTYTALANSGVPLDTILDDAGVETSSTNLPLFQVLVNYRMGAIKHKTLGNDIALEFLAYEDARHPFDYILTVDEDEGRGGLTLSMQNYLYDQTAGNLFLRIYINLLDTFSRASDLLIKEPPILPTVLRQEALDLGRGETSSIARPSTLPAQVDKMISKFSGDIAIKDGSRSLSYREMSAMIHTIAMSLRQKGVTVNQRVGVFGGPSVDVVLSLLALLRLGAVYVPLDERNSDERITSMILDAKLQAIIHSEPAAQRVSAIISHTSPVGMVVVPSKPNPNFEDVEDLSSHNALAMIMFTSGSTGKPKGIMLKHQNLWTHVQAATSAMRLGRETVLHQSALGYDASLAQIFYALANGGTLVVSDNRQEMSEIAALMTRENVSLTLMAPSEYAVLFQYGATSLRRCSSWRVAMCGGEAFPPRLRLSFRDLSMCDLTVWNAYGKSSYHDHLCIKLIKDLFIRTN